MVTEFCCADTLCEHNSLADCDIDEVMMCLFALVAIFIHQNFIELLQDQSSHNVKLFFEDVLYCLLLRSSFEFITHRKWPSHMTF